LRQVVDRFGSEHLTSLTDLINKLAGSECSKPGMSFFLCWEDQPEPWGSMPLMLLVGPTTDGEFFRRLNTLDSTGLDALKARTRALGLGTHDPPGFCQFDLSFL
jgi:hypothetical protein